MSRAKRSQWPKGKSGPLPVSQVHPFHSTHPIHPLTVSTHPISYPIPCKYPHDITVSGVKRLKMSLSSHIFRDLEWSWQPWISKVKLSTDKLAHLSGIHFFSFEPCYLSIWCYFFCQLQLSCVSGASTLWQKSQKVLWNSSAQLRHFLPCFLNSWANANVLHRKPLQFNLYTWCNE